jgi:hypothetical protein
MLTAKKLVDTYRHRSSHKNPDVIKMRRQRIDPEEDTGLKKFSMQPARGWHRKDFNENLSPLWRFLNRSVGRRWDEVYADICKRTDRRSTIGAHIFQHLFDYIHLHPTMIDGVPHYHTWDYENREPVLDEKGILKYPASAWSPVPVTYHGRRGGRQFWVDPKDGILKRGRKPQKSSYSVKVEEHALECKQNLVQVDRLNWLSRHPDTKVWILLTYQPQEWMTKKYIRYRQNKDGYSYPVEYEQKVRLHDPAPPPKGLKWFPGDHSLGGDCVLKKTRTASKQLLRKMNL